MITIMPATILTTVLYLVRNPPTSHTSPPKKTNISVKPRTNESARMITLPFILRFFTCLGCTSTVATMFSSAVTTVFSSVVPFVCVFPSSSSLPAKYERYNGIIGKRQGEINDASPSRNVNRYCIRFPPFSIFVIIRLLPSLSYYCTFSKSDAGCLQSGQIKSGGKGPS